MYCIYANIWGILMVNVTIYGIHGSYGLWKIDEQDEHESFLDDLIYLMNYSLG